MLAKLKSFVSRLVAGATTKTSYPWVWENTGIAGKVFLPVVPVELWLPEKKTWLTIEFLIDTGADLSVLPASLSAQLGLNLAELPELVMAGLEGTGVRAWMGVVEAKVDKWNWRMRVLFVDQDDAPFLLGRKDVFDGEWKLTLDPEKQRTILAR